MVAHEKPSPPVSLPSSPTLDYGQRTHLSWLHRCRKFLVFLAVCVAIAVPIYRFREPLKHRAVWLYWSHEAAAYRMPNNPVDVVINDSQQVKRIATTNPDYLIPLSGNGAGAAIYSPRPYRQLLQLDSRLTMTGFAEFGVVFMGTLRRPDGVSRLVLVTGNHGIVANPVGGAYVLVLPLPGILDPLPPPTSIPLGRTMGRNIQGDHSRDPTYSSTGVPIPEDPSSIRFQFVVPVMVAPGRRQVTGGGGIRAYLQNDDSLKFILESTWGTSSGQSLGPWNIPGDVQTLQSEGKNQRTSWTGAPASSQPTHGR